MYWADKLVKQLDKKISHRVDDMKTPSGRAHVGSLRAIGTHGLIYEAANKAGLSIDFTYVVNDMDPMDGLPIYLDKKIYQQHMGKPLFMIPSPDAKQSSYGHYFAYEYISAFNKLGFKPKLFWSHELYQQGKFNDYIKLALDNVNKIRKIYLEVAKQKKPENWYPFQVICPRCQKVGCSLVTDWNGKEVSFECKKNLVSWAVGCGYKGQISPLDGTGKLMWKVDWPAHWGVLGITIEGAGKEHLSAGGSYDIAKKIATNVFKIKLPLAFLHEFFLFGGAKMSSSKGVGMSAGQLTDIVPPELARFILVKTPYNQAANLNPTLDYFIPHLFDEYDLCAKQYFKNGNKTKKGRLFEASQIEKLLKKSFYIPRFRKITQLIQMPSVNLITYFESEKGSKLSEYEKQILEERIKYAKIWIEQFAHDKQVFQFQQNLPEAVSRLSSHQKKFISYIIDLLKRGDYNSAKELQTKIFELIKDSDINSKSAFQALYLPLLGKDHGPKIGWLIFEGNKKFIINRLDEAINIKAGTFQHNSIQKPIKFTKTKLLSVDNAVISRWPTITVGYVVIKNVKITITNPQLETEKNSLLLSLNNLTNQDINSYPEIISYRKIYKDTKIDWHSRRPSPEALIRRIAQKKGIYSINTCVDAYNLVVVKNRISSGVFDLDKIKFPVMLRLSAEGEKILLLGDKQETILKQGEICYFDKVGPYNLDFNYRDAQRTMVTTQTQNLWINIEGVYQITKKQVKKTLEETIAIIQKYCGGEVIESGIII